ncbi:MAG: hypothetical protein EZS28_035008, partial [Streblomastix strix]
YPKSPETQDGVQGRLRSTFEFIQDYLVRAGRRRHNPGLRHFRQVLESNIRDHKEEGRLAEDPRLSNSEQRVANRVFQVRGDNRYSRNNSAHRLGHNDRSVSSIPSHQSSRRDSTVSMLQFNGHSYSYKGMPFGVSTAPRTFTKCLQPVIAEAKKRCSSRIFFYLDDILILNQTPVSLQHEIQQVMQFFARVWMDDRNGQEPDQSHADNRVFELVMEHENNNNVKDNIPKEGSVKVAKTSDRVSQEKETYKNKGLDIGNWRDSIHMNTIQTRRTSHQVALKVERQGSSQWRLEQVDSTQQERDTRHNLVDQHASPQLTTVLHETKQMDNDLNRCFEFRIGATLIRENQGKVFAHGEWKDNNHKSSNLREVTAVLKELLEFRQELTQQQHIGIRLLTDNIVIMYCLNKGKGSITIAPLVDKVLKLAERYNWIIEASHIPSLSNTIPDSLSRLFRRGDYAIKKEILLKTLKELGIQISIDIFATRAN